MLSSVGSGGLAGLVSVCVRVCVCVCEDACMSSYACVCVCACVYVCTCDMQYYTCTCLSPIPRYQDWACVPSPFRKFPICFPIFLELFYVDK